MEENGSEDEDENEAGLVQGRGNRSLGEFHPCQPEEHRQIGSQKGTAEGIAPTAGRKNRGEHLAAQRMEQGDDAEADQAGEQANLDCPQHGSLLQRRFDHHDPNSRCCCCQYPPKDSPQQVTAIYLLSRRVVDNPAVMINSAPIACTRVNPTFSHITDKVMMKGLYMEATMAERPAPIRFKLVKKSVSPIPIPITPLARNSRYSLRGT